MCQLSKGFGCIPLRKACVVIALIGMGISLRYIIAMVFIYGIYYLILFYLLGLIFEIVVFGVLLVGAMKNNSIMVLVHLVLLFILIKLHVIAVIVVTAIEVPLYTVSEGMRDASFPLEVFLTGIIVTIVAVAFYIYGWVVTFSFYQELKTGGSPYSV